MNMYICIMKVKELHLRERQVNIIYGLGILLCFLPCVSPALALAVGLVLSFIGIRSPQISKKYTSKSLQYSIVLMGFGMSLTEVVTASKSGFMLTACSVLSVMTLGLLLSRLFKVENKVGVLISAGTAICGGSAIAAVSPVIKAKNHQISLALVVVFVLNAVALVIFPPLGKLLGLSQETFGQWAAIAIHDTSSVVGASAVYGEEALQIATTVKLIRALWIIPLSLIMAFTQPGVKLKEVKIPWFILMFVGSIIVAFLLPQFDTVFGHLYWLGKRGMVVALFLIGTSVSLQDIKQAGFKPFLFGILLWAIIGVGSLLVLI